MLSDSTAAIAMKVLTRGDLLCVNDAGNDVGIAQQIWLVEDHGNFFVCGSCNDTPMRYLEPCRLLSLGMSELTKGLGEAGWKKPYVVVTQAPDAVGTVAIGQGDAVFPIMWRTVADDAENLWYFVHEMTEYRLITEMGDLPRWFWEGLAQVVALLIVREIDPAGASAIQQRYLSQGMASVDDLLQWDKLWDPGADSNLHLSAEATLAAIFATAEQVHFTAEERRKYAKALEFFSERIRSMAEARCLFDRAQQLPLRTTKHLLGLMEVSDEYSSRASRKVF